MPAYELGPEQRDWWLADQLAPKRGLWQQSQAWWLDGELDLARLKVAAWSVAQVRPELRLRINNVGGRPVSELPQGIQPVVELVAGPWLNDSGCLTAAALDATEPHDINGGAVWRIRVFRRNTSRHLAVVTLSEVVASTVTPAWLWHNIGLAYHNHGSEASTSAPAAAAASSSLMQTPPIVWPTQRGDNGRHRGSADVVKSRLDGELRRSVAGLAQQAETDEEAVLRGALRCLLSRHTGQREILVGREKAVFLDMVRAESKTVPPAALPSALAKVASAAGRPIAQVMVTFRSSLGEVVPWADEIKAARADLRLHRIAYDLCVEIDLEPDAIGLSWRFDEGLFSPEVICQLAERFEVLLRGAVSDPSCPVSTLPVLSPADRVRLASADEQERAPHNVPELVDAWVAQTPNAVAVRHGERSLTYDKLAAFSDQIAATLHRLGVEPETRVGVLMRRGVELPAVLLGILKAGCVCVPLDPAHPAQRHSFVLLDSKARFLVAGHEETVPADVPELTVLRLTDMTGPAAPVGWPQPQQLAYVLYTSGSTGEPKGVGVTHSGLANCMLQTRQLMGCQPGQRLLAITTATFDISALELFLMLISGGQTIVAGEDEARNGELLAAALRRWRPDYVQATPMTIRMLFVSGWCGDPDLVVSCGGDLLESALASALTSVTAAVWHTYGPTEASLYTACELLQPGVQPPVVPIGTALAATELTVRDENWREVPPGVIGELCIGGVGVARGYLGRPGATAHRFVPDPRRPGKRLYRTGDLARMRADGRFELHGRADRQVKIRGHRIEPGEIETVLSRHPDVAAAAVVTAGDGPESQRIVAYLQPMPAAARNADLVTAVSTYARSVLPAHMVPSSVVLLDCMPLNPHGKVDRRALPTPPGRAPLRIEAAGTPERDWATGAWTRLLGRDAPTGVDFFAAGGDLFKAVELRALLLDELDIDLPMPAILDDPTVAGLAERIQRARHSDSGASISWLRRQGTLPALALVCPIRTDCRHLVDALEADRPVVLVPVEGNDDPAALARSIRSEAGAEALVLAGHGAGVPLVLVLAAQLNQLTGHRIPVLVLDGEPPGAAVLTRYRGRLSYVTTQDSTERATAWRAVGRRVSVLTIPSDKDGLLGASNGLRLAGIVASLG